MNDTKDLHLAKEILPLFDFVGNESARSALIELLSDLPGSIEKILSRQQILKTLLANKGLYAPFSYHRSEFNDIYRYMQGASDRNAGLSVSALKLHYFFARSECSREKGQLGRLFIFLHQLNQAWFARLNTDGFPDEFAVRLNNIKNFFKHLEVGRQGTIAREKGFSTAETARLFRILAEKSRNGQLDAFWKDLFLFEAYLSVSNGIRKNNFVFPSFRENGLAINGFYHPILKDPIRNNLFTKENVTLITGPNMSGKSTLLKAIGLCVLLAHLGLAVPAESCEVAFFETLSVAINLNDDLQSGYSHFMTEVKALKNVVNQAASRKKCFAIFDELFRGTNVEDTLALSRTTITGLARFSGSCFFISTHLHQLKETLTAEAVPVDARHIECRLENGRPVFTYRLLNGWSDLKIGQILFEQEGLNELLR